MSGIIDFKNEIINRTLAETVAWCEAQQIVTNFEESDDDRRRRNLEDQARELFDSSRKRSEGFWNRLLRREFTKGPEWRSAMELSRQADSIPRQLASQFRSPALKPSQLIQDAAEQDRKGLVGALVAKRSDLLRIQGQLISPDVGDVLKGGRLLCYRPSENVEDGASEVVSRGFFDSCDAPPWDTWVAYGNNTLLSWVPQQLIGVAQSGIEVNPVDCVQWLK